jgi:hypothetical protein
MLAVKLAAELPRSLASATQSLVFTKTVEGQEMFLGRPRPVHVQLSTVMPVFGARDALS